MSHAMSRKIVFAGPAVEMEEGGGPACCGPPAAGADGFAFVELIYARRVVAMGEVDLHAGRDRLHFFPSPSDPTNVGRGILVRPGYSFSVLFLFTRLLEFVRPLRAGGGSSTWHQVNSKD